MGTQAAIAGASGYAGGELLRVLLGHPSLEVGPMTAGAHAGAPVADVHPHLRALDGRVFDRTGAGVLAEADVIFLALPHGESARLAGELRGGPRVVDLGADHRLASATDWWAYYGTEHAAHWVYGLPELPGAREAVAHTDRVANPGCYATAVTLAFAPLLGAGLVEPDDLVAVAASGTTGAGRAAKTHLLGSEVMGSLSPYKVTGSHQHIPEIEQALNSLRDTSVTLSFTPILAPMPRGILATCTARPAGGVREEALREVFEAAYGTEQFVQLLPEGSWPRTADTVGSNAVHLQVGLDRHAGRVVVVVAIDNLGKGAAGQAVQNANLMLGLAEDTGLTTTGVTP